MGTDLGVPGVNPSSACDGLILSKWQLSWAHFVLQNEGISSDQHYPIELPAMMETFSAQYGSYMLLLNMWDVLGMAK